MPASNFRSSISDHRPNCCGGGGGGRVVLFFFLAGGGGRDFLFLGEVVFLAFEGLVVVLATFLFPVVVFLQLCSCFANHDAYLHTSPHFLHVNAFFRLAAGVMSSSSSSPSSASDEDDASDSSNSFPSLDSVILLTSTV